MKENPAFWMLPEIHESTENSPLISGKDSLMKPAVKYMDFFIKPFLSLLPAFVQDATSMLNKLKQLENTHTHTDNFKTMHIK